MCGIAGALGATLPPADRVATTLERMRRRGPDATGTLTESVGASRVALLFTRLAILDLDPRAGQPFERDGLALVYNGEIYNYVELRRILEAAGHAFHTTSDTEVLLAAWQEWGEAALGRLEGMWAFALLDRARRRLILSRDRFGEKPLYLWRHGDGLFFGSEVKVLESLAGARPIPDRAQIRRYLVNGYKSLYKRPRSWFEDVWELPAGTWAAIDLDDPSLTVRPQRYWALEYTPHAMTEDEALDGVRAALTRSLRIRLRSDVPVAFCLSGGIDSPTLAGLAAKTLGHDVHAFSVIDSDERYDEEANIDAVVDFLGCPSVKVRTSREGFLDRLARQVAYHDGPVATLTYYLHNFLSEAIAARGYRVALSGTAADEIFTGYYDHYSFWLARMHGRPQFERHLADWRAGYGAFVRNPKLQDPLTFQRDPGERGHIYLDAGLFRQWLRDPFDEPFEEERYTDDLLRNRMMNELFHEATPVILHEDDLNSMEHSVENRSPYLDRDLVEFLYTVPPEHLIRDGYAKWLLRRAGEGVVPDAVRLDKRKRGFNASIESLVDREDPETRDRLLATGPIFEIVRRDAIERFLTGRAESNSFSKFLFSFISARLFLDRWAGA